MIYEIITYTVKPNQAPKFLELYEPVYAARRRNHSELIGCWFTDIGTLNQVIQIWPYESLGERERIVAAAGKDGEWPDDLMDLVVGATSEIYAPFPFSPPVEAGEFGAVYEMRIYDIIPGTYDDLAAAWRAALPARRERSRCAALLYSELGGMHKLVHLWPYADLNERARIRRETVADRIWPPSVVVPAKDPRGTIRHQVNMIMLPAAYSPMR